MNQGLEILKPFRAGIDGPWDRKKASHLLRRAGFGGNGKEVEQVLALGPQKALDQIFEKEFSLSSEEFLGAEEKRLLASNEIEVLEASWLFRMILGRQPLREKLCLFWHGHFATSNAKVKSARLMHAQNLLFFRHGLGAFEELLLQISKDPAMLIWLDSTENVKSHPNENYARELMELFSLGIGNYTEKDIQEAARAFTGWMVSDEVFSYRPKWHDAGEKSVFGKSGNWEGEDIVRMCSIRVECAEFLTEKFLRYFVLPDPEKELVGALAKLWVKEGLRTSWLLETVFRSKLFFSDRAYRSLIKSPVEFAVGAIRSSGARVNLKRLAQRLGEMGQRLYHPPTVKGWDGGRAWINAATALIRVNTAQAMIRPGGSLDSQFELGTFFTQSVREDETKAVSFVVEKFLDGELNSVSRQTLIDFAKSNSIEKNENACDLLHLVMSTPEYQLN